MFLLPLSLQNISELTDPKERVSLAEANNYKNAELALSEGSFEDYSLNSEVSDVLNLKFFFTDRISHKPVQVTVSEEKGVGSLNFFCSHCELNGRWATSCEHRWQSYILLWQALHGQSSGTDGRLDNLKKDLQPRVHTGQESEEAKTWELKAVLFRPLDSKMLFESEQKEISRFQNIELKGYRKIEIDPQKMLLSPRLWELPEIFHRTQKLAIDQQATDIKQYYALADAIWYYFSDGTYISAREILRHPRHRRLPAEILPLGLSKIQTELPVFERWPFLQSLRLQKRSARDFVSQAFVELEAVMQSLIYRIVEAQRQAKLELWLDINSEQTSAIRLAQVEFGPHRDFYWRMHISETQRTFISDFKLMKRSKQSVHFWNSFCLEPEKAQLTVHPWLSEFESLREQLSGFQAEPLSNFVFEVKSEKQTQETVSYLRSRSIPVEVDGQSIKIPAHRAGMDILIGERGDISIRHEARVDAQMYLQKECWTATSNKYLKTLEQGLAYFFAVDIKELASGQRQRREWDLKLLRHLGIVQYVFFESLSVALNGQTSELQLSNADLLWEQIQPKIMLLLLSNTERNGLENQSLEQLCSRSVLTYFDEFIKKIFQDIKKSENFYSEFGEIILDGAVEKEWRLLLDVLRSLAFKSNGDVFRKSRIGFLTRMGCVNSEQESLNENIFLNLGGADKKDIKLDEKKNQENIRDTLTALQALIPFGMRIYYKGEKIHELGESEFSVRFDIQSGEDQNSKMNWFELNPSFFLMGQQVHPEHLLSLGAGGVIEFEGKLYLVPQKRLPPLKMLESFWQKLQKGRLSDKKSKLSESIYTLPRHQVLELLALRAAGIDIKGDSQWQKLCDFYDNLGENSQKESAPDAVKNLLKPYQLKGFQWIHDLYQLKLGALLADDMGLGKTLQTLSFLESLRQKNELGLSLVVVPTSLVYNWQQEIEKFTPELPLVIFNSRERDKLNQRLWSGEPTVVVTTYGLLMEHEKFFSDVSWKILVLDEAQNIKNITARRTSAARSLSAQFKVALTGTPMENHYGEFYSLVDLLVPGSLGPFDEFRRMFVSRESISREAVEELKLKIKPLLLRRTKKEILDQLPEKQETRVSIAFEEQQKQIYRDIAMSYNQRVQEAIESTVVEGSPQGRAQVQLQMLTALLRLRQACSDPGALPEVEYKKVPPKIETLRESLQEIIESGESALVFTQFLQTLEHTVDLLKKDGLNVYALHGAVPSAQRQKILSEFSKPDQPAILVMTLKTGGVGLNLTKASYVFHLEPWWNPAVENQATDRAHRIGQSKAVQVFKYIMHESLEEKIEVLKARKDQRFQILLTQTEKNTTAESQLSSGSLTQEDFQILLGLR